MCGPRRRRRRVLTEIVSVSGHVLHGADQNTAALRPKSYAFCNPISAGRYQMRINIKLPIGWETTIRSEVHRATEVLRAAQIQTEGTIESDTEAVGTITLQIGTDIPKVLLALWNAGIRASIP
jgi:hypothetical protein